MDMSKQLSDMQQTSGNHNEEEWRAHVGKYKSNAEFPYEIGEIVWILKPSFRAPLGEFRISKALPNNTFELVKVSDNTVYPENVEEKYLRRDAFSINSQ